MDLDDLLAIRDEINAFHDKATKAPTFKKMARLREEAAEEGYVLSGTFDTCLYIAGKIEELQIEQTRVVKRPPLKPVAPKGALPVNWDTFMMEEETRILLGPILKVIHESGHKFPGSNDPEGCIRFCSKIDGKWGMHYDELTVLQQGLFRYIKMDFEKTCKAKGITPKYYLIQE